MAFLIAQKMAMQPSYSRIERVIDF